MAYDAYSLKMIAGKRGDAAPRIWTYRSTDAVATVRAADYFSDAFIRGMRAHDIVYVQVLTGSAATACNICYVLSVDGDGADLSDGTAIVMTNT